MVVNVGGMCWVMMIGCANPSAHNPLRTADNACGPPVELPMAMTSGRRRAFGRKTIGGGAPTAVPAVPATVAGTTGPGDRSECAPD